MGREVLAKVNCHNQLDKYKPYSQVSSVTELKAEPEESYSRGTTCGDQCTRYRTGTSNTISLWT
jgi:hypothetical protein